MQTVTILIVNIFQIFLFATFSFIFQKLFFYVFIFYLRDVTRLLTTRHYTLYLGNNTLSILNVHRSYITCVVLIGRYFTWSAFTAFTGVTILCAGLTEDSTRSEKSPIFFFSREIYEYCHPFNKRRDRTVAIRSHKFTNFFFLHVIGVYDFQVYANNCIKKQRIYFCSLFAHISSDNLIILIQIIAYLK